MKRNHVWIIERSCNPRGYATRSGKFRPFHLCHPVQNRKTREDMVRHLKRIYSCEFRLTKYVPESALKH